MNHLSPICEIWDKQSTHYVFKIFSFEFILDKLLDRHGLLFLELFSNQSSFLWIICGSNLNQLSGGRLISRKSSYFLNCFDNNRVWTLNYRGRWRYWIFRFLLDLFNVGWFLFLDRFNMLLSLSRLLILFVCYFWFYLLSLLCSSSIGNKLIELFHNVCALGCGDETVFIVSDI